MPVAALVDECPLYDLEPEEPAGWLYGNRETLEPRADGAEVLRALLASPNVASKRWAFEQYDSIVAVADRAAAGGGGRGGAACSRRASGR